MERKYAGAVAAVAAVQGFVIALLATAGYFYLDDVDMIAEGGRNALTWSYLATDVNDHFAPGPRAVYWALAHVTPYDNGVTVAVRVLLQVVATLLLGYLLSLLVGRGRLALVGVGLYAFSPLLVPSLLCLSSAVHLLPTHVGTLLLVVCHLRFHVTRRYRYACGALLGLVLGLFFWEKAVLGLVLPVLLVALYLATGGPMSRLRVVVRDWPAWLLYLLPVAVFFGYYIAGDYPKMISAPRFGDVWQVFAESWWRTIGPTVVGGPWTWFTTDTVYFGYAWPLPTVRALGLLALIGIAVTGVRRNGWAALRAWVIVAVYLAGTAVLLAAGRFDFLGTFVVLNLHYYSEVAIPLVVSIVLCLGAPTAEAIRGRVAGGVPTGPERPDPRPRRYRVAAAVAGVAAYAVSYAVTVSAFEARWVQNPIHDYLTTAIREFEAATREHPISVRDALAPNEVAPYIQRNRWLSDILRPAIAEFDHPVTWVGPDSPGAAYVVDPRGRLIVAG